MSFTGSVICTWCDTCILYLPGSSSAFHYRNPLSVVPHVSLTHVGNKSKFTVSLYRDFEPWLTLHRRHCNFSMRRGARISEILSIRHSREALDSRFSNSLAHPRFFFRLAPDDPSSITYPTAVVPILPVVVKLVERASYTFRVSLTGTYEIHDNIKQNIKYNHQYKEKLRLFLYRSSFIKRDNIRSPCTGIQRNWLPIFYFQECTMYAVLRDPRVGAIQ